MQQAANDFYFPEGIFDLEARVIFQVNGDFKLGQVNEFP